MTNNGTCIVAYSNIQGTSGFGGPITVGPGVFDANPLFVDPTGFDFHLRSNSPCIDAGDPSFVADPGETDGDGDARVLHGRTDIGWDERP